MDHLDVPPQIADAYYRNDTVESRERFRARWELLVSGNDGPEAADAAIHLCFHGNAALLRDFCLWCFGAYQGLYAERIGQRAFTAVLRTAWLSGRAGSALTIARPRLAYRFIECLFDAAKPGQLMKTDELKTYRELPDEVLAYRGCSGISIGKTKYGMSWTLDRSAAAWFACRNARGGIQPCCVGAVIPKTAVLAYFNMEKELVVRSGHARQVRQVAINEQREFPSWKDRSVLVGAS